MDFRIRQLQCFLTLAELLNYGKTARTLYMSQPTITFQIQSLEEAFGVKLFERDRKQVRLTQAGETLRGYAQTILDTIAEARTELGNPAGMSAVRITCGDAGLLEFLPLVLRTLERLRLGVEVDLVELTSEEQMEHMAERKLDAMVMTPRLPVAGVSFSPLCSMELRATMSRRNPMAQRESISIRELHGQNVLVTRPQDCRFQAGFIEGIFSPYQVVPRLIEVPQASSVQLAYAAADAGILIRAHANANINFEDVIAIPFVEPLPLIELGVMVLEDNQKPALTLLLQVLAHCAARFEQRNALPHLEPGDTGRILQFPQARSAG